MQAKKSDKAPASEGESNVHASQNLEGIAKNIFKALKS